MENSEANNTSAEPKLSTGKINRTFVLPPNLLSKLGLPTYSQSPSSVENDTTKFGSTQLQLNDNVKERKSHIEKSEINSPRNKNHDSEGPNNAHINSTTQDRNICHELPCVEVTQGLIIQETSSFRYEIDTVHLHLNNDNLINEPNCATEAPFRSPKSDLMLEKQHDDYTTNSIVDTSMSISKSEPISTCCDASSNYSQSQSNNTNLCVTKLKLNKRKRKRQKKTTEGKNNKHINKSNTNIQIEEENVLLSSNDKNSSHEVINGTLYGPPQSDLVTEEGNYDIENTIISSPLSISKSESISICFDAHDTKPKLNERKRKLSRNATERTYDSNEINKSITNIQIKEDALSIGDTISHKINRARSGSTKSGLLTEKESDDVGNPIVSSLLSITKSESIVTCFDANDTSSNDSIPLSNNPRERVTKLKLDKSRKPITKSESIATSFDAIDTSSNDSIPLSNNPNMHVTKLKLDKSRKPITKSESIAPCFDANDTSSNDSISLSNSLHMCVTKFDRNKKPRKCTKNKCNIDSNVINKSVTNDQPEKKDVLYNSSDSTSHEVNDEPMQETSFVFDKSSKRTKCKNVDDLPITRPSTKRLAKINKSYDDFDLSEGARKRKRSQSSDGTSKRLKLSCDEISALNINEEFLKLYINLKENVQNEIDIDFVVCKSCNKKTYNWEIHKLKHNNMTCTITEQSVDYTYDLMKDILEDIWQKTGVLICEKCCHSENTVALYMEHIKQCKYTCKAICELCDRKIKKLNKDLHLELHNSIKSDSIKANDTSIKDIDKSIKDVDLHKEDVPINDELKLICAICKQHTRKTEWNDHKLQHNNLAWYEGQKPISMTHKYVKKTLQKVHKQNKKLICFFCKYNAKTVADYMKHFRKCGPDDVKNDVQNSNSNSSDEMTIPKIDIEIEKILKKELEVHETEAATANLSQPEIEADVQTEEIKLDKKIKPNSKEVVCSKCNESMLKNKWITHKLKHNNLAWNDQEDPLDLNDRKLCERILLAIIKKRKKLKCEHCGTVKKSVLGFVSHTDRCNKTEEEINQMRELCTLCGRTYFRTSMQVHMNQAHSGKVVEAKEALIIDESTEGRTPRKAAAKALSIIDNMKKGIEEIPQRDITDMYSKPGAIRIPNPVILCWKKEMTSSEDQKANCRNLTCQFRSSDISELKSHHMSCELSTKRGFWCSVCSFRSNDETTIRDHIKAEHPKELEKTLEVTKQESEPDDDYSANNEESESEYDSECSIDNWDKKVTDVETNHSYLKRNRGVTKFSFILMEKFVLGSAPICYPVAYKWTLKFREKNYSKEALFPDWYNSTLTPIPSQLHMTYFGASQSSKIACINGAYNKEAPADIRWRTYELFEGSVDEHGTATVFCGGPVWGLAWCPFNDHGETPGNQYLAVSTHRHWDDGYEIDAALNKADAKGAIQIWDMGVLDNATGKCVAVPKLLHMIAHNLGAIWKLEWCPSGGLYENITDSQNNTGKFARRLGLLAVACSKGDIYIYSVCEPQNTTNNAPLYDQKPVTVLRINHLDKSKQNYHATALCWSKDSGHNIFAGGFSNGFIALWNLAIESKLLKHKDSGMNCIHPYQVIKAHLCNVTALHLIANQNGSYLFTASSDRTIEFWQLDASSGLVNAVPVNSGQLKGNRVTASAWNLHWLTTLVALDDICSRANSSFLALRDLTFKPTVMLNSNSLVWDTSSCDWSNGFIHVTEGGEVSCAYPHQLMAYVDSSKNMRTKKMVIGYSRIHKLDGSQLIRSVPETKAVNMQMEVVERETNSPLSWNENLSDEDSSSKVSNDNTENSNVIWEDNYKDIVKNHGILFHDLPTELDAKSCNSSELQCSAAPHYPLNSITRVSYNPNYHSHSFIAIGMQAGFVRVRCISGMRTIKRN